MRQAAAFHHVFDMVDEVADADILEPALGAQKRRHGGNLDQAFAVAQGVELDVVKVAWMRADPPDAGMRGDDRHAGGHRRLQHRLA